MAAKIFHGDPGTYKTSTAIWYELLPALRQGRCVITNIEGFFDLETIERALGETFPESAQLWRFSTLKDSGLNYMARWFQWAPVGSLILLDEVQNIYSKRDRTDLQTLTYLDGSHSTRQVMESFSNVLPAELLLTSFKLLDGIEDDGYVDDSGVSERDINGDIIYPKNIKDAFMRHRKYNWDIIVCTPDIAQVHDLIRQTAEVALRHVSFDFIPIPYFQRRPRCNEHNAKDSGLTIKKGHSVLKRKVPLNVFKLYKSTQTGKSNKSGQAANPLKSISVIFVVVSILSILVGEVLYFTGVIGGQGGSVSSSSAESVVEVVKSNSVKSGENLGSSVGVLVSDNNASSNVPVDLPDVLEVYGVDKIYLTSVVTTIIDHRITYDYSFTLISQDGEYSVNGDDLEDMGYQVGFHSVCSVVLLFRDVKRYVYCPPRRIESVDVDLASSSTDSSVGNFLGG